MPLNYTCNFESPLKFCPCSVFFLDFFPRTHFFPDFSPDFFPEFFSTFYATFFHDLFLDFFLNFFHNFYPDFFLRVGLRSLGLKRGCLWSHLPWTVSTLLTTIVGLSKWWDLLSMPASLQTLFNIIQPNTNNIYTLFTAGLFLSSRPASGYRYSCKLCRNVVWKLNTITCVHFQNKCEN